MENRIYDKSWDFLFKADEAELKEIHNALQNNGIKDLLDLDKDNINPDTVIACLQNSVCKKQDKSINYKSFISTLCNHLELNLKMSDTGVDDIENTLMSYYLQEVLKHCPERYLNDIKAALNLINDDRESMAKEVAVKTKASTSFKKTLPFLATISTSTWLTIRSLAAFAPTVMSTMLGPMGLAVGALSAAFLGKSFTFSKKDKATKILPAVFVIIRIRREQSFEIQDSDSAINYVDYLIRSNTTSNNLTKVANDLYYNLNNPNQPNPILSKFEINKLSPFKDQINAHLTQYHKTNYIKSNTERIDLGNSTSFQLNKEDISSLNREQLEKLLEKTLKEVSSYKESIDSYKAILHGIRHNLSCDFQKALDPYRDYLDDKRHNKQSKITDDTIKSALSAGETIIESLKRAGDQEYNEAKTIDLVHELKTVFSNDCNFTILYSDTMPKQAMIDFDPLTLHTDVLNNIRKNLEKHAFGQYSDRITKKTDNLVLISITGNAENWTLTISNNGSAFLGKQKDCNKVFEYGKSYSNVPSTGTGMFFIKQAIKHYGGDIQFKILDNSIYKVQYLLTFKKHKNEIQSSLA